MKLLPGGRRSSAWLLPIPVLVVMAFLLACGSGVPDRHADQPSILLIVVDTLRASNVSFMGYSRGTTPNLDALAARSFVFDEAVSVGGNTTTAMSAIMTGQSAYFNFDEEWAPLTFFGMNRFYTDDEEIGLPSTLVPLAERLHAAGYTTAGFITNPYLKRVFNFHRGFDQYDEIFRDEGIPYGLGETVASAAIDFLDLAPQRPFFLYLHFMDVHGPYSPPEPYFSRFASPDQPPLKGSVRGHFRTWEKSIGDLDVEAASVLSIQMGDIYDGAIAYVDHCIGEVLVKLKEMGLDDEAIIVVTSDHGEEFLEHGGTTHQGTLYEELVRVPLVIYVPDVDGTRVGSLVRNFDIMPTLLDLAGIDRTNDELDAVSLEPILRGGRKSLGLTSFAAFPWSRMLRTPRHKLVKHADGRIEFYDLEIDPGELHDLHDDESPRTLEAKRKVDALLASTEARFGAEGQPAGNYLKSVDQTTEDQLRSLGYLD